MVITKNKGFYKNFFSLFSMIVLQNIIVLSVNLADNIMVGSYSETALSGVAAVNQIQFVFRQIIMGTGDALVVMGSQYWGQRRTEPIKSLGFGALSQRRRRLKIRVYKRPYQYLGNSTSTFVACRV